MKTFLNVGGGPAHNLVPPHYNGWKHERLDIDPAVQPDVLMDARELHRLPEGSYDAVLCAHNLEHYFWHDAQRVVRGFVHVLKPDGFVEVRVPDLGGVIKHVAANNLEMDDILYQSAAGPISVRDIIYGYQIQIQRSGVEFYAHRNGFTQKSLIRLFSDIGFSKIVTGAAGFEIAGFIFKQEPTDEQKKQLGLTGVF